ncbi:TOMM precursor leader peptide-binding protein [Streptomyces sp. RB6PN25]|uniref:TOMM leader peptide-binding protein n=1 Tax=Streptomyces humicola TaxID=2953240 RepID=A0ABT1PSX9_9ACTN|nr:TOMM precursor leader peptide-binding protein [Streptomyces humicola]MCQ4080756.1 TOMM precursor leader peptide-binding protein [Streptomyces humicola]
MPGTEARLKRSIIVVGHSPDVVELRVGVWSTRSYTVTDDSGKGKLLDIVSGLDGSQSHKDLARAHGVPRATVEAVVDHLRTLDAIEWGPTSAVDAYLDQMRPLKVDDGSTGRPERAVLLGDPQLTTVVADLLSELDQAKTEVLAPDSPIAKILATPDLADVHDGLRLARLVDAFAELRGAYVVLAQETVNPAQATLFNRVALEAGITWTHAAVDGPFLLVGPTIVPGSSPCYQCFETRVAMNLRSNDSYVRYKHALAQGVVKAGSPPLLSALRATLAGHTALEAVNYLTCGSTFTIGKVLGIYLPTMEISHSEVLRLPGCPSCGSLRGRDDASLYFDARAWLDA